MSMVSKRDDQQTVLQRHLVKRSVSVRMIAYTPTLVSKPANTAVTGAGAVG